MAAFVLLCFFTEKETYTSHKQVLCIDSDLVSLLSWSSLLKHKAIQIIVATEEEEALAAFTHRDVSLVVLTTAVDNHGGIVHRMRSSRPDVPIILFLPAQADGLHAVDEFVGESSALLETAVSYLDKPVD